MYCGNLCVLLILIFDKSEFVCWYWNFNSDIFIYMWIGNGNGFSLEYW